MSMQKLAPALFSSALALSLSLAGSTAHAQNIIKHPGDHPDYSVELEPHLLLGWGRSGYGNTGLGLGMHAVIPFLDNGPVSTINNNMGIGFGLDWAHYSNDCRGYYGGRWAYGGACDISANSFMFPVYVQWNFFFTKVISVYGEAGLFIAHDTWESDYCGVGPGWGWACDGSDTNVYPWFSGGGRFLFSDTVGLNVRLGYPMLTVGASILL